MNWSLISSLCTEILTGKRLVTSYHGKWRMNINKLDCWVGWTSQLTTIHRHPRTAALVDEQNQTGRQSERPAGHNSLSIDHTPSDLKFGNDLTRKQVSISQSTSQTTDQPPMLWIGSELLTRKTLQSEKCSRPAIHRLGRSNRSFEVKESV